jgi:hypothetical protein
MKHDEFCPCNNCKLKGLRNNLARLIMNNDCPDAVDEVLEEISVIETFIKNMPLYLRD